MKVVIQRVKKAQVEVQNELVGQIAKGLLILLGVEQDDDTSDIDFLVTKIINLRIFDDPDGKMNLSSKELQTQFLVVSQFTLLGDCRRGRRPSFDRAADPQKGEKLYTEFVQKLKNEGFHVETGRFRAMMDVSLTNDGPVTFVIDSKDKS